VASEQLLDIPVCRHALINERPFQDVLDGIYGGISQPDIGALFARLAACTSYEELSTLVGQAKGSAGLMRFLHLDDDHVLAPDPQARDQEGRRLVRLIRLIAGNPATMGQIPAICPRRLLPAGHHPDPGTGRRRHPGGLRHRHQRDRALPERRRLQVAQRLGTEVLTLLRRAIGIPTTATAAHRSRRTP
jgi:hypothetical protein